MFRNWQPANVHCVNSEFQKTSIIVRSNLDTHLSDTPFGIRQPIQRPRLLDRVYKPICTPHSSHFTFLVNMAPDCGFNITGPASNTVQGFFVMNIIAFTFLLLCLVPFRVQLVTGCDRLCKLHILKFFTGVFTKIHCIWESIIGLYRVARLCRQLYAPVQKSIRNNHELNKRSIQTAPLTDEYTMGFQFRPTLVLDDYSPLLAPLTTEESTSKTVYQPPKPTEDKASDSEIPISQVTLLSGTTPRENCQLQHKNTPDDISDILGTRIYQGYVETPIQTLDGIVVSQPKRFLPLAEEAKCLT